jgi:hypothetical protein
MQYRIGMIVFSSEQDAAVLRKVLLHDGATRLSAFRIICRHPVRVLIAARFRISWHRRMSDQFGKEKGLARNLAGQ